jgi:hypothetical protein
MAFQKASLTLYGLQRIAEAHKNEQMVFTSIGLGDEALEGNLNEVTGLTGEKQRFLITSSKVSGNNFWAACKPLNIDDPNGIYVRSMGLYIADPDHESDRSKDKLYSVASIISGYDTGPDYFAYIPHAPDNTVFDYKFALHTIVSSAAYIKIQHGIGNIGIASDGELGLTSSSDEPGYCSIDPITGIIKANDLVEVRAEVEAMKEEISRLSGMFSGEETSNTEIPDSGTPDIHWSRMGEPGAFEGFVRGFLRPCSGAVFDPIYADGPAHGKGAGAFMGGVLAPNGKVILVPHGASNIGIYDPVANAYADGPAHNKGAVAFMGGVLAPNGKVILAPRGSPNIGIYDPVANAYADGPAHNKGAVAYFGCVLAPNGKVILISHDVLNIGVYDPVANTYADGPAHGKGAGAFMNCVLAPNGKVILVPRGASNIGIYDPVANTYADGPAHGKGAGAFMGGVLAPNGKVILVPYGVLNIGVYDPVANTYADGPVVPDNGGGFYSGYGGVLAPNGKVIFVPHGASNIGIYDPVANTYADGPAHGNNLSMSFCCGGVLAPNGKVILVPRDAPKIGLLLLTGLEVGLGYCLHPFITSH